MKKLSFVFALAFVAAIAFSCKKDYTCDCSYTADDQTVTASVEFVDAKKADAEEACDAYQATLAILGTGATCELK